MAKIKEESLRLNIIINGDNARKQMAEYEKVLDDLTKEQKRLKEMRDRLAAAGKTETQQYQMVEAAINKSAAAIEDYSRKLENMRKGMPLTSMTLQELKKHAGQTSQRLFQEPRTLQGCQKSCRRPRRACWNSKAPEL